jgi:hypothetical protein
MTLLADICAKRPLVKQHRYPAYLLAPLFALAIFLCFNLDAQAAYGEGQVLAKSLKVMDGPSVSNRLLGTLNQGDTVFVIEKTKAEWAKILFKGSAAFVLAKQVEIIEPVGGRKNRDCDLSPSSVELEVTPEPLRCEEEIVSRGRYERCSIALQVAARSSCTKKLQVYYTCRVDYEYKNANDSQYSQPSLAHNSQLESFFLTSGAGSTFALIRWQPGSYSDKVVMVKLRRVACDVTDVFD